MCVFCRLGSKIVSVVGIRAGYIKHIAPITVAVFRPSPKRHKSPHQAKGSLSVSNKCKIKKIKPLKSANLDHFIE